MPRIALALVFAVAALVRPPARAEDLPPLCSAVKYREAVVGAAVERARVKLARQGKHDLPLLMEESARQLGCRLQAPPTREQLQGH